MKRMGVIGGIGPQATMDFQARIHEVSQRLVSPVGGPNSGYPPMVVVYLREPPIRLKEDGSPIEPVQPSDAFLNAAKELGPLCDFIVINSNGAHVFQREAEEASGRPVFSMVETTLQEVQRRGWRRVGALGLGYPRIYTEPLAERGIAFETVDQSQIAALDEAIFDVMAGRITAESRRAAEDALRTLRERGVDGIILGCTGSRSSWTWTTT